MITEIKDYKYKKHEPKLGTHLGKTQLWKTFLGTVGET